MLPLKLFQGCYFKLLSAKDMKFLRGWNFSLNVLVVFVLSWKNNCPVISILINMHMSLSVGYTLRLVDSTIMKNWWTSCNLGQAYEHEDSWNMMTLNKQCQSRANGLMWCANVLKKKKKKAGMGSRQVNVKNFTKVGLCWTAEQAKSRWKVQLFH